MEDVLDLYEEPYDPKRPVVCFDEMPYQMVAEKRIPLPAKPGRVARYDYEYERRGMINIFAFFEPKAGWRRLGHCRQSVESSISTWLSQEACLGV